eukprot:scaffold210025_cov27-Tisochrysis_lutea.AAC.1
MTARRAESSWETTRSARAVAVCSPRRSCGTGRSSAQTAMERTRCLRQGPTSSTCVDISKSKSSAARRTRGADRPSLQASRCSSGIAPSRARATEASR